MQYSIINYTAMLYSTRPGLKSESFYLLIPFTHFDIYPHLTPLATMNPPIEGIGNRCGRMHSLRNILPLLPRPTFLPTRGCFQMCMFSSDLSLSAVPAGSVPTPVRLPEVAMTGRGAPSREPPPFSWLNKDFSRIIIHSPKLCWSNVSGARTEFP